MDRRRAWVTAAIVVATLVTAILAVMANTGLLTFDRPARRVGRLTPAAVSIVTDPSTSVRSTLPAQATVPGATPVRTDRHPTDHDGDHDDDD